MQKTAAEKPTKAFDLVKTFNSASLSISKLAVQPKRPPPPQFCDSCCDLNSNVSNEVG